MHISLDSALGRQRRLNSVGESVLQIAPDAAAAYSLRSLTGGDPDVVRVRRETDNTEKDFSGSQIESGEMARWVNEQPTLPLDLRELDEETGERDGALIQAAAAYSLRNLKASGTDVTTSGDTAGDTTGKYVVQVRRSSDDAVKSFTAAEVADGTLEAWVNADATQYMRFEYTHGSEKYVNLGAFPNATNATITFKCLFPNDSTTYRVFFGASDVGNDYVGLFDEGSTSTILSSGAGSPVIKVDGSTGWGTTRGDLFDAVVDNQIHTIEVTAANISTWTDLSLGMYGGSGESGSGIIWDVTIDETGDSTVDHSYNGYGNTDADWEDQTGSQHGTVNGSPTSILLNDGYVRRWYDQSGSTPSNDAVQADATKQPKIVSAGTIFTGGMRFDDNQFLETSNTFTYGSGTTLSTFIANSSDGDESSYLLRFASDYIIYNNAGGGRRVSAGTAASAGNVSGDQELWTTISELNTAGGTSNFYADGTLVSAADAAIGTNTVSNRVLNIGGSGAPTHWNGTVNEVILYATDQSDNRTAIEANIGETYGITAIPAANDEVNGYVQTWYDQSGNEVTMAQPTAAKQPQIVSSGSVMADALYFGDGDFNLIGGDSSVDVAGGATVYAVINAQKGADLTGNYGGFLWSITDNVQIANNRLGLYRPSSSDNLQVFIENIAGNIRALTFNNFFQTYDGVNTLVTVETGASDLLVYVNGSLLTPDSASGIYDNDVTASYFSIGGYGNASSAGELDQGGVLETVLYDSNSTNRAGIEANIANQYGITLS